MRTTKLILKVLLLAACLLCLSCKALDGLIAREEIRLALRKPAARPPARLEVFGRVPVVHLYGTPEQMGRQYGQLLGGPLRALRRVMGAFLGEPHRQRLLEAARRREPHLPESIRQELRAVAEASGVSYEDLVALNVTPRLACSALAVWGPARDANAPAGAANLILGRNADYFPMGFSDRGMLVVVRHPSEGRAVAAVSFLGMVGAFTGVNDAGVCFGNMLVFNAAGPAQRDDGLAVQLALRLAAAEAGSSAEMVERLAGMAHAIPMNVMVADAQEALVAELALHGVRVRRGDDGVLAATNFFLSPGLRAFEQPCRRYDSLLAAAAPRHARGGLSASKAAARRGEMTVDRMKAALHEARIEGMNLQAVVFEPGAMRMHVSINHMPATAGPYVEFDLRALFAAPPTPDPFPA